jgi:hypothetical protein
LGEHHPINILALVLLFQLNSQVVIQAFRTMPTQCPVEWEIRLKHGLHLKLYSIQKVCRSANITMQNFVQWVIIHDVLSSIPILSLLLA